MTQSAIPYENVPDHLCPGWTPILAGIGRLLDQFKLDVYTKLNLRCSNTQHSGLPWITATDKDGQRQYIEIASHVNFVGQSVSVMVHFHPYNDTTFESWIKDISFQALHDWVVQKDPSEASDFLDAFEVALDQCFSRIPADRHRVAIKTN